MRKNPERTAWLILSIAFSIFCTLSILVPTGMYWYSINATRVLEPNVTSVRGTILLNGPDSDLPSPLVDGHNFNVEEGFVIATDDTSQAIITFFDDSSLTLYSNTSIVLNHAQEPRFWFSPKPTQVLIDVQAGRVRATSSRSRDDLIFDLYTPHSKIELEQGSFSIEVDEEETQITNRLGQSTIIDGNELVILYQGQRAVIKPDNSIVGPLPAEQNLIDDSNFNTSLGEQWQTYEIQPIEGVTNTIEIIDFQGRNVLKIESQGQDNLHTETGVIYEVNKDVRDFQSLRLFAEVRLIEQSLAGGGTLGSEFPVMLHIAYEDVNGEDRDWFHGFYYKIPPDNYILYNHPDNASERVPRLIWYPYESVNLLTTLGPTKPAFIKSVRIYASGWIYESMVANVSLLAQE